MKINCISGVRRTVLDKGSYRLLTVQTERSTSNDFAKTTEKLDSYMRVSSFSNAYERLYDASTDYGMISWLLICVYYLSSMPTIWTK